MSKPAAWSLEGEPPEPQSMPVPTPTEVRIVQEKLAKEREEAAKARQKLLDEARKEAKAADAKAAKTG